MNFRAIATCDECGRNVPCAYLSHVLLCEQCLYSAAVQLAERVAADSIEHGPMPSPEHLWVITGLRKRSIDLVECGATPADVREGEP